MVMRRRCIICNLLTYKWHRYNNGPWHCYDGCYSTTGHDRRSDDGKPIWEKQKPLDKPLRDVII